LKSFFDELILLFFEDIGYIELLKFLVCKVDEELLKRVYAKYFKAKYIEDSYTFSK
jgi:hypothetical protein